MPPVGVVLADERPEQLPGLRAVDPRIDEGSSRGELRLDALRQREPAAGLGLVREGAQQHLAPIDRDRRGGEVRARAHEINWRLWMDGLIATLGTAAVGAAFVFDYVAGRAEGSTIEVATSLKTSL